MGEAQKKWLAGGLGFVFAFVGSLPFVHWGNKTRAIERERMEPSISASSDVSVEFDISSSPTDPAGWLAFGKQAGSLSANDRELALRRVLEFPENGRREPLMLLLLRWLESEPGAAVLWCQENLKGIEHRAVLRDLATTWAHRDAFGVAYWWAENMPDSEVFSGGMSGITGVLARTDPFAYATYMDIPRLHKIRSAGVIEQRTIPSGDQLPVFALRMIGNVGYHADRPEILLDRTLDRHLPGKSGWNDLFEKVAIAWHQDSPAACEAWLSGFPEEAQIAARYRIKMGW